MTEQRSSHFVSPKTHHRVLSIEICAWHIYKNANMMNDPLSWTRLAIKSSRSAPSIPERVFIPVGTFTLPYKRGDVRADAGLPPRMQQRRLAWNMPF
jgi:hypothetical protein